jgi:hypothetical protein
MGKNRDEKDDKFAEWRIEEFEKRHFYDISKDFKKQKLDASQGIGAFPKNPENIEELYKILSKYTRENSFKEEMEIKIKTQISQHSIFRPKPQSDSEEQPVKKDEKQNKPK